MATSLLLLLDDIASVLDDVATMTKVAATKTAGVVGDDLALNAKQVAGVAPARELPVVWAVAMGSALNKAILVPAAVVVSWLAPWAIPPLLVAGGAFLCFEGAEKILHAILHRQGHHDLGHGAAAERGRIKGAIRTDFILSAEIIVITLGIVQDAPLVTRLGVLVAVAILMTIGVYGLVAAIVKLDDVGAALAAGRSPVLRGIGAAIVSCAPWLMRGLSIAGTAAMFLVGGGIVVHQLHEHAPAAHEFLMGHLPGLRVGDGHGGQWAGSVLLGKGVDAVLGLTIGLVIAGVVAAAGRAFRALTRPAA